MDVIFVSFSSAFEQMLDDKERQGKDLPVTPQEESDPVI